MCTTGEDYRIITEYEGGPGELTPAVEGAYLRLCAAFALGLEPPEGIRESWWNEKLAEWGWPLEIDAVFRAADTSIERCEVGK